MKNIVMELNPQVALENHTYLRRTLKSSVAKEVFWQILNAKQVEKDEPSEAQIDWNERVHITIAPEDDSFCVKFKKLDGTYEEEMWFGAEDCDAYDERNKFVRALENDSLGLDLYTIGHTFGMDVSRGGPVWELTKGVKKLW